MTEQGKSLEQIKQERIEYAKRGISDYFSERGIDVEKTESAKRILVTTESGGYGWFHREEIVRTDGRIERVYTIPTLHGGSGTYDAGDTKRSIDIKELRDLSALGFRTEITSSPYDLLVSRTIK